MIELLKLIVISVSLNQSSILTIEKFLVKGYSIFNEAVLFVGAPLREKTLLMGT